MGPTSCCFNDESLVFSETGAGMIRLLTDVYPMAAKLMPVVYNFAAAHACTADKTTHTTDLKTALDASRALSSFFDETEDANFVLTGRRKDAQGPCGNFSICVRKIARARVSYYARLIDLLAALGVPKEVADAASSKALGSSRNEKFFSLQRCPWPVPYYLQYLQTRSRSILEDAKQNNGCEFSNYNGPVDAAHYSLDGSGRAPTLYEQPKPPQKRTQENSSTLKARQSRLVTLRAVARRAKGKQQGRPSQRQMDAPGAHVDNHWAPMKRGEEEADVISQRLLLSEAPKVAMVTNERATMMYRAGEVVAIMVGGIVRIAQLRDQVVRISTPSKKRGVKAKKSTSKREPERPHLQLFVEEDGDDTTMYFVQVKRCRHRRACPRRNPRVPHCGKRHGPDQAAHGA